MKNTVKIGREQAIILLKEISLEVYPCSVRDEFDIYQYSSQCISHYLKNNNTDIGCYITDNYEYGLLELIYFIGNNELDGDKLHIAQQLLSALAEYGYENDSYVEQNKREILFRLYDNEDIFRKALLSYMNPLMMRDYHYLELAREGMKEMAQLQPLVEKIAAQVLWADIESLPNILEFEYIFPNGKQGDIIKYIFDEYGENTKVSGLIWNGKIEKEYVFMFDMLYPISESCGYKIKATSDDPKFFDVFKHHVPTMIEDKLTELIIDRKINTFTDTYNNLKSSVISSGKSFDRIRGLYDETHEAVQKAFENNGMDFKEKIHGYISNQSFAAYKFYIRVLKDGKQLTSKTYKEFMEQCEKNEWYVEEYEFIEKKNNYNNALKEFGISKSVYNDWRSQAYCEKDFDKKMFVNMAFILGLNYENAEKLLNLNGYTFESVGRQFDEICRKAFKIGFSRDMTIALIEKRNRELAKGNIKFALIPNLTSNKG